MSFKQIAVISKPLELLFSSHILGSFLDSGSCLDVSFTGVFYWGQINIQTGINAHLCSAASESQMPLRCWTHFNTQEHFTPQKHINLPRGKNLKLSNPNCEKGIPQPSPPPPIPPPPWVFLVCGIVQRQDCSLSSNSNPSSSATFFLFSPQAGRGR